MNIDIDHLNRCISTLRAAWEGLQQCEPGDVFYDIYRAACVKEFELVLEQSGRLLKRRLRPYFASNRQADQLYFNDGFRHAAKHCLIRDDACERWLEYRAARNETAREYGEHFAEKTLELLPQFIVDADALAGAVEGAGMAERLHLKPRHRRRLEEILRQHVPGVEVWAYGSRGSAHSHDGSDLDLDLRAPDLEEVPIGQLVDLEESLRLSTIPFLVEARDWARLPESFYREIERDYVVLLMPELGPINWTTS